MAIGHISRTILVATLPIFSLPKHHGVFNGKFVIGKPFSQKGLPDAFWQPLRMLKVQIGSHLELLRTISGEPKLI